MSSSSSTLIFVNRATHGRVQNLSASISVQLEAIDASLVISSATMMMTVPVTDNNLIRLSNIDVKTSSTALLQYTSGSTGKPKLVEHTHRSLISALRIFNEGHIFRFTDNILQLANCQWISHTWDITVSFWLGSTLVLLQPNGELNVDYIIQTMGKKQISALGSLPSTARLLAERVLLKPDEYAACLSSLRAYTIGGKLKLFCHPSASSKAKLIFLNIQSVPKVTGKFLITNSL